MAEVGSSRNTTSGSPAIASAQERTDVSSLDDLVKRRWPGVEPPDHVEGLVNPDAGGKADARAGLEHGADPPVGNRSARIAAENLNPAFLRSDQTEERRNGGRLAGTVRPQERKHLTLGHFKV
jgi:hypothetical protein